MRTGKSNLGAGELVIVGVDEAGRGPLAGPVTAAAVVPASYDLKTTSCWSAFRDSKQLRESEREEAFTLISEQAIAYAVVSVAVEEIDKFNILQATLIAMRRAVDAVLAQLQPQAAYVLIDGNQRLRGDYVQETVVKGDQRITAISAASILAKVTRDRIMAEYDSLYPQYGFARHKGYGTQFHREQIKRHGPTPIHRTTFAGVREHLPVSKVFA